MKTRFACALAALDRRDFPAPKRSSPSCWHGDLAGAERAFLLNKRGVARIGLDLRELARADFAAALEARARATPRR